MRKLIIMPEYSEPGLAELLLPQLNDCLWELWASTAYIKRSQDLVRRFSDMGASIHSSDKNSPAWEKAIIFGDDLLDSRFFKEGASRGALFLLYYPHTDILVPPPARNSIVLFNSEAQMRMSMGTGRFWLNNESGTLIAHIPGGGYGAAAGFLRHGSSVPEKQAEKRAALKAELAVGLSKELGAAVSFRPDRPLVLQHMNNYMDDDSRDRGFERLARHADIILKGARGDERHQRFSTAAGDNIFKYFKTPQPDLDRRAADFILPGAYSSGAMTTSLMLGYRIIPVFTRHMHLIYYHARDRIFSSFVHTMRMDWQPLCLKVLEYVTPICLESTDMLVARINDSRYWAEYEQNLGAIQKNIFGHFRLLPDSLSAVARLIRCLLERGGLEPFARKM